MERLVLGITRQLSIRGWDAELLFGEGPRSAEVRAWAERNGVPSTTHPAVLSVMEPRRSWASVRDLYRLKTTKTLSFGERRMMETARNLVVTELAVSRKWTEEKVECELEKAFAA